MKTNPQNYPLHLSLLLLTVLTTLWAGAFWGGHPVTISKVFPFINNLSFGVQYSFSLLLFLSVHEFGHFIAARRYRVMATLPYYIPLPPLPFMFSLGTMGAVIKIRERIPSTKALFDIGVTGPLSGFIVCSVILLYGFLNLPPADFIHTIHPEFQNPLMTPPQENLTLGKNLLWILLEKSIAPKNLPPMTEMYHYPFLFAGWLGSLVTALNLLPVGQLDGGHIIYAMFGKGGHAKAARGFLIFITILGFPSLLELLLSLFKPESVALIPDLLRRWSWSGWILWAFILSRVIGLNHPQVEYNEVLPFSRKVIGWVAITIFLLTFTPVPFGIN